MVLVGAYIDLDGQPPPLIVLVGEVSEEINPWDLRDEDAHRHYHELWAEAQVPIVVNIRHLLDWTHDVRFVVLSFIATLRLAYRVRPGDGDSEGGDLFDVVLAMMVSPEDPTRCERGRRAATETAGLLHASELRIACSRILSRLQTLHVRGFRIEELVQEARAASPIAESSASETN